MIKELYEILYMAQGDNGMVVGGPLRDDERLMSEPSVIGKRRVLMRRRSFWPIRPLVVF